MSVLEHPSRRDFLIQTAEAAGVMFALGCGARQEREPRTNYHFDEILGPQKGGNEAERLRYHASARKLLHLYDQFITEWKNQKELFHQPGSLEQQNQALKRLQKMSPTLTDMSKDLRLLVQRDLPIAKEYLTHTQHAQQARTYYFVLLDIQETLTLRPFNPNYIAKTNY